MLTSPNVCLLRTDIQYDMSFSFHDKNGEQICFFAFFFLTGSEVSGGMRVLTLHISS